MILNCRFLFVLNILFQARAQWTVLVVFQIHHQVQLPLATITQSRQKKKKNYTRYIYTVQYLLLPVVFNTENLQLFIQKENALEFCTYSLKTDKLEKQFKSVQLIFINSWFWELNLLILCESGNSMIRIQSDGNLGIKFNDPDIVLCLNRI